VAGNPDEAVSAKLAELAIVMSDLERANERVNTLERDNVQSRLPSNMMT